MAGPSEPHFRQFSSVVTIALNGRGKSPSPFRLALFLCFWCMCVCGGGENAGPSPAGAPLPPQTEGKLLLSSRESAQHLGSLMIYNENKLCPFFFPLSPFSLMSASRMEISSENKIKPAQGMAMLPYFPKGLVRRSKFGVREHPLLPPPERSGQSGAGGLGSDWRLTRSPAEKAGPAWGEIPHPARWAWEPVLLSRGDTQDCTRFG